MNPRLPFHANVIQFKVKKLCSGRMRQRKATSACTNINYALRGALDAWGTQGWDAGGTRGGHEIGCFQGTWICNYFWGFGMAYALPGPPILQYNTKQRKMALWIATIHRNPMPQHGPSPKTIAGTFAGIWKGKHSQRALMVLHATRCNTWKHECDSALGQCWFIHPCVESGQGELHSTPCRSASLRPLSG